MNPKKTKPAKNPNHRQNSFRKERLMREAEQRKAEEAEPTCDLCNDDTHVGFVDDACTFKVCKFCDTDGSQFSPKDWPQDVLDEINIDRDTGEFKQGDEE